MRSSLARAVVAAFLLLLTCFGWCQIKVQPPGIGEWEAWIGPGVPGGKTNYKSGGPPIELPLGGTEDEDQVTFYDGITGNLGTKSIGEIENGWKVEKSDFTMVAVVIVEVSHRGQPVAAANVSLKSSQRTQTLLLTPSQQGRLTFKNVMVGPIEISVSTAKDGKPVQTPKQIFQLSLNRNVLQPVFRVALAEPVDVVGETSQAQAAAPRPAASVPYTPPTNPISSILSIFVGLGFVALIAYLAWRFLPQFKPQIDAQLQKVGVQISDDQTPDDEPPAAPVPARAPVEPIILGADAVPAAAAIPATSSPTFVNQATQARIDISEGKHLVTREAGSLLTVEGSTAISRRHAEVERAGDALLLRDLGSTNGTFVNGVKVAGDVNLKTGDLVQFGDIAFRVEGV